MVAAKIANMKHGGDKVSEHRPDLVNGKKSNTESAQLLNVGKGTVIAAKKVQSEGTRELVEAVEKGEVSVSAAAEVATLPKREQKKIVKDGKKGVAEAAKKVKASRKHGKRWRSEIRSTRKFA